jgi:hypothetical protein
MFGTTDVNAELLNSYHFDHNKKITYIQMWFNVTKDLLALEFKDHNEMTIVRVGREGPISTTNTAFKLQPNQFLIGARSTSETSIRYMELKIMVVPVGLLNIR